MSEYALLILVHQLLFQGMFFAKNYALRRKLGKSVRGDNREANLAIGFFVIFIGLAFYLAQTGSTFGNTGLVSQDIALAVCLLLIAGNLFVGLASLKDLGDSWRVGVIEEQQTALVQTGIYRFTRNPYFVAYLLMFAAYTVLLQNLVLLLLSLMGFGMVHAMILKEEKYLESVHGETYHSYRNKVPRYLLF